MNQTIKNLCRALSLPLVLCCTAACADVPQPLQVPEGFRIETLNFSVPNARQMALTDKGTLIVGTRRAGRVYAVPDALSSPEPEVVTLVEGLSMPSGVTVRDGDLYIGALDRVLKIADIDNRLDADPPLTVITDSLPDKSHHGWKYLKFGPDGALYVPVGAPCNICLSDDERFASILRMDPADGSTEVWAHGVRNSVGFAWHPADGRLWFSDNGRDMLGDDIPPEEINVINTPGEHFGYPFVHANGITDPEFGDHPAGQGKQFTAPALEIQAHSAALGMTFYTHEQFGPEYLHALFVAEHGSWNRSSKVGYLVSVVTGSEEQGLSYQPFVTGWLVEGDDWGRPNDVLVAPDGSLLISDDKQGVIYRVSR
jgi:glucose/arabinose dehydrogenase